MRRLGKRIVAITMAAAMMTSLTPQGCMFLQRQIVYAEESGTKTAKPFYIQTESVTTDTLELPDDDWGDQKPVIPITESVSEVQAAENFDMTAEISIDAEGYQSLAEDGDYLKLQGVVKIGADWTWTDSQDIPYLEAKNFEKDGDVYKTNITIKFRDITVDDLRGVYFVVVTKGFKGKITFADTTLTALETAQSKEELAYTCDETGTAEFDFSGLEAEDWDSASASTMESGITGATVGTAAVYRGKVTIDGDTYASLAKEGNYIKLQTVMKLGDDWTWTQGGSYPYLTQASFSENTDGTYSAEFEDKYSDIAGGELHELIVRAVGIGAKGSFTVSDVKIYNVISADAPLPEKDPATIDNFDGYSANDGTDATGWKNESGWQYEKEITPVVAEINGSNALKLNLDYTGCEEITWSEAKVNKNFKDGYDVSAYNVLSYAIIYPEAFAGFKAKVFAKNTESDTTIIDKEGVISDEVTLDNGMKKATVTVKFSPNSALLDDMTIGTIGVNTSFKGDVYIDNIKLSQYNASEDYVDITAQIGEASEADISGMPTKVSLADDGATAETLALYSYLQNLDVKDQVLFGHQNDTHKSVNTKGTGSDTKDVTGSISGVVGIDSLALTGAELGLTDTDEAVKKSIEIGKDAAAEGAILTLSMHMPNMSNAKIKKTDKGYDFSECDFAESKDLSNNCAKEVLPGGKYNAQFTAYLDIIAEYANGLKDTPVLFRPFHECDGGWFWWGNASTDNETYKALFRYTEDYLNEKGVDNFIYIFSPGGPVDSDSYLDRYPGDDYVDVLAFDYYDDYSSADAAYSEEFMSNLKTSCQNLKNIADEHGKVAAIAESGVRVMKADGSDQEGILVKNNPIKDKDWYKNVNNVAKETGMSYFLLWANFSDTNFYIPYKYNDTKGQELINEFIEFYNEDSSIFADGTNFYNAADQTVVENTNDGQTSVSGYITNIISKEVIKEPTVLKANVKNGKDVAFVLKNGDITVKIPAVNTAGSNEYTAEVTAENLQTLGKTDIGTISLVSGDKELAGVNFISFGKEKDVLPANVLENFELYYGDDGYLGGTFSENSAAGCSSKFTLDSENKANGSYGGAFTYTLKNSTSEVWTGRIKGTLTNTDFSGYNAIQMWVKPDKVEKKMVVQLTDGTGEEFEVYLSDFTSQNDKAQYVTIPFSSFKGKQGGTLNTADIQKFAVWCNSVKDNTDVTSSVVFDDIQAVNISASEIASKDANGLIITDEAIGTTEANNGGSSSGSGSVTAPTNPDSSKTETLPDGTTVETKTETKADGTTVETVTTTKQDGSQSIAVKEQETNAAGNKVEVTTTTEKDAAGNVTGTTEEKVIADAAKNTSATVTTETSSTGDKTVTAEIVKTGTKSVAGTKGTISSAVVAQITEAAGTKDVEIKQTVVDAAGKTVYTVTVNAGDLKTGEKLRIFKYNEKTGEYILCNNKDYKVSSKGGVALTIKGNSDYKLLNRTDADKVVKNILATVKVSSSSKTLSKGKTTKISLSKKLNMANVSRITYSSTKSSVAKVDKKGKITAKKSGTATVKAKVTLKNGKTKTVTMKIKVK